MTAAKLSARAAGRVQARRDEVEALLGRGDWQGALHAAVRGLTGEMAKLLRRDPLQAAASYPQVARHLCDLTRTIAGTGIGRRNRP